jgi:hypothetical protein
MAPLRARFVTVEAVEAVLPPLTCAAEVFEPLDFTVAALAPPTLGARVDAAGCGDFETAVEIPFEMDFEVDFEVVTETGFETV